MINREANEQIKAFRLQKLRAIFNILDYIENEPDKDIAVAIEIIEDVYVATESSEYYEQDKDYDPDSSFTLNSEEILKSFCSFLDIWVYHQYSPNIKFCFLATNKIGKERESKRISRLNLVLPSTKILEELSSNDNKRIEDVSKLVQSVIFDYYRENFASVPQAKETLSALNGIDDCLWLEFLKQINWSFLSESIEALETEVIEKIKRCKFYSKYDNKEQENNIKNNLLELVEKKSLNNHKIFRLVVKPEVQLTFSDALLSQEEELNQDEVHSLWETIETPNDKRNLRDKILSVCPSFDLKKIEKYERKVSITKVSEASYKNSTQYLALKYRVYDYCDSALFNKKEILNNSLSETQLEEIINEINDGCVKEFKDLKKQFDYSINRDGIIIELFFDFVDNCYLAFD